MDDTNKTINNALEVILERLQDPIGLIGDKCKQHDPRFLIIGRGNGQQIDKYVGDNLGAIYGLGFGRLGIGLDDNCSDNVREFLGTGDIEHLVGSRKKGKVPDSLREIWDYLTLIEGAYKLPRSKAIEILYMREAYTSVSYFGGEFWQENFDRLNVKSVCKDIVISAFGNDSKKTMVYTGNFHAALARRFDEDSEAYKLNLADVIRRAGHMSVNVVQFTPQSGASYRYNSFALLQRIQAPEMFSDNDLPLELKEEIRKKIHDNPFAIDLEDNDVRRALTRIARLRNRLKTMYENHLRMHNHFKIAICYPREDVEGVFSAYAEKKRVDAADEVV